MPEKNDRHAEDYRDWRQTPHGKEVYSLAVIEAELLLQQGHNRYSAQALVNVIRHHRALTHGPEDDFKINNNYVSFLAREMMDAGDVPEGFFQIRDASAQEIEGQLPLSL